MKFNLYLVESPLQALNALEISLNNVGDWNGVIYKASSGGRKRSDHQIESIINLGQWDLRSKMCALDKKSRFNTILKPLIYTRFVKREIKNKVDRLFIGEFRSRWMHFSRAAIKPNEVWLMDDGAATLNIVKKYLSKGIYYPQALFRSRKITKRFLDLVLYRNYEGGRYQLDNEKVHLVSSFMHNRRLEENFPFSIQRITYENIKKLFMVDESKESMSDKVLFFGSKLSEAGIVSQEKELEMLQQINSRYKARGISLFYIAHRDDCTDKLRKLKDFLQGEILELDDVAEVFLLKSISLPVEVAGFYTSALLNVAVIFSKIKITSFEISHEIINPEIREDINNVYIAYKRNGIHVVPIN